MSARSPLPNSFTFRVGAKRCASLIQFMHTDVGATTSVGPFGARARIRASACKVLPSPMSSARQAPTPQCAKRASHW